jgi:subtilisin family serine protease
VVSVAAIDEALAIADFSQQNDQVEIAAPGVAVLSTVPFINFNTLTVDGATYDANHIEFAANGTVTGNLVDGGLCDSTGSWSGAVVLCERGVISFYDKVMNVQNSGGAAAVIYNNAPGNFLGTLGDGNSSAIVAISLSQEDGQFLVANKLGLSGTVESTFTWPASGYESWDGTSMATPHVSAVAALIWSAYPTATNQQVRDALTQTTLDLGPSGRDNAFGFGLVQAVGALEALSGGGGGGGGGGQLFTSVTTDKSTYVSKETVYITVNVTDDAAAPVAGASVEVRITVPKGKVYAGVAITDANGTAVFTFGTNSGRDGKGTYVVDATATLDGYTPGSGSTTFIVQ